MSKTQSIIGRYAPSPTGDLHLGNLRTAMLAWLKARLDGGKFLLRMEDLDQPRVVTGSADQILRDLEWLGLDWDGEVLYQSKRAQAYEEALALLDSAALVYPCFCSRKDIQTAISAPHSKAAVYPGICRDLGSESRQRKRVLKQPAFRVRVSDSLEHDVGDFVIKRADGLFAYQLAVVVDDLYQDVTQVVRGADLYDSLTRQQYLAHTLAPARPPIEYFHAPLMLGEDGVRLAKRDGADSIKCWRESGKTAEQLLAFLYNSLGLESVGEQISLVDLSQRLESQAWQGILFA